MNTWGVAASGGGSDTSSSASRSGTRQSESDVLSSIGDQLRGRTDSPEREIPRDVEDSFAGTTEQLTVPGSDPTVTAMDLDARFQLGGSTELPEGEFLLECTADPHATATAGGTGLYVRFEGAASVKPDDDSVTVSFWKPTRVTVGHQYEGASAPASLTVEPTTDGLATAVTHMAAAHRTMAPARSHPGFRDHPPLVRVGEETDVPSAVLERTPETGIELRLPDDMQSLFVAAPLAYYLGAHVSVEDRDRPVLTTTSGAVRETFGPLPDFQHECAQLLRRLFYLDCQTRRLAPERDQAGSSLLSRVPVDLDDARSLDPVARLQRYLDVPATKLDEVLPDWHLTTFAAPGPERTRSLPYLLDRLSLVFLPEASELESSDLLDRTLDDAFQARGGTDSGAVLQPEPQAGRVYAWMAPGRPIDAFKTTPTAYENRLRHEERRNDRLRVAVVLNDEDMDEERETVAGFYRRRSENLPIDVTVHDRLPTSELASVFEARNDFVHYIGHCDDEGLRCPDGNLDVATVDESRTRTFFLNACGSYEQGLELVEQGSIAGAVTYRKVLDAQAAKVGTTFARLIVHGFSFERALQLARRRIMMGKDYAAVGDGTYALLPSPKQPVVVWLEDAGEDSYHVSCEVLTAQSNGERYRLPFDDVRALNGSTTDATLSAEAVRSALSDATLPVIFEGDVHWSNELVGSL